MTMTLQSIMSYDWREILSFQIYRLKTHKLCSVNTWTPPDRCMQNTITGMETHPSPLHIHKDDPLNHFLQGHGVGGVDRPTQLLFMSVLTWLKGRRWDFSVHHLLCAGLRLNPRQIKLPVYSSVTYRSVLYQG